MLAVEFETHSKNGVIKMPRRYRDIAEENLRILILKQEKLENASNRQRSLSGLKDLLKKIQDKNLFKGIENPLEWQRQIRDELA